MRKPQNINQGFTLVELLIIIVVLAILVAIVLPMFGDSSERAKVASSLATLQTLRQQLNLAKLEHDEYFPDLGGGGIGWDILLKKTEPTSTAVGTYTLGNDSVNDVGPYLTKRPINLFEDSDTVGGLSEATRGLGFTYDQKTGIIKLVISYNKFKNLNLSLDDFEYY